MDNGRHIRPCDPDLSSVELVYGHTKIRVQQELMSQNLKERHVLWESISWIQQKNEEGKTAAVTWRKKKRNIINEKVWETEESAGPIIDVGGKLCCTSAVNKNKVTLINKHLPEVYEI